MANAAPPPGDTSIEFSPVTVEAVNGLCGAQLPDGRGFLAWINANRVRFAIVPTPGQWLRNNYVEAGDIATAISIAGNLHAISAFVVAGNLYLSAMFYETGGSNGFHRIYRAVDPSNPAAGWVVHGTPQQIALGTSSFLDAGMTQAGIPHVDGTSWIYTGGRWSDFFGQRFARCGLWYSSDGGATWVEKINQGFYLVGGSYIDYISPQISRDPTTGYLYWATAGGVSNDGSLWRSTDGGVSWSIVVNWGGVNPNAPKYLGATSFAGKSYVVRQTAGTFEEVVDFEADTRQVHSTHLALGRQAKIVQVNSPTSTLYLFSSTTVQSRGAGGWGVGRILMR